MAADVMRTRSVRGATLGLASLALAVAAPGRAAAATAPSDARTAHCEVARTQTSSGGDWGQLRLGASRAWSLSRGDHQVVALVGSGVDARVPALSGRVMRGADLAFGSSGGRTDCAGSGTAMAGMIVGQAGQTSDAGDGSAVQGISPGSMILPVYVSHNGGTEGQAVAAAIKVATTARADVIVFDHVENLAAPAVVAQLQHAAAAGVVTIVPSDAVAGTLPAGSVAATAVGVDGHELRGANQVRPAVLAPGVGLDAVGITGVGSARVSGHQFAAAYAAGEATLLRSRYPHDSAAAIVARMVHSGDATASGALINPVAALRAPKSARLAAKPAAAPDYRAPGWVAPLIGIFAVLVVGLAAWWARRLIVNRRIPPDA